MYVEQLILTVVGEKTLPPLDLEASVIKYERLTKRWTLVRTISWNVLAGPEAHAAGVYKDL